jgi:hypothetical protein
VKLFRFLVFQMLIGLVAAQSAQPERHVQGHVVQSERDPALRIELPASAQYVGADRWILYDIADCEVHVFVDADAQRNVQRLYWVQFEGYVPSKPELHHEYDSPRHARIGGLDFFVDTWVRAKDASTRPGSDREHITALIKAKGYKMPANMMDVRLVHLLDPQMRKELMIIYGEDLGPTGFTVAQLDDNGEAHDRWPALEKGLIERAEKSIKLEPALKQ